MAELSFYAIIAVVMIGAAATLCWLVIALRRIGGGKDQGTLGAASAIVSRAAGEDTG